MTAPPPTLALTAFPRSLPITGYALAVDERAGRAFVGGKGVVSVLDTRTGSLLRAVATGGVPVALTVDQAAGRVYVALDETDSVAVLNACTDALLYRARVTGQPTALALAPREGRVFIGAIGNAITQEQGGVSVLDMRSGTARQIPGTAGASVADIAIDERTGRVFALDKAAGTVSVLDASRRMLLHTTPVGVMPSAISVAPDSGRVFVAGNSGIIVLDAHTGARLPSPKMPDEPAAVVDDATYRRVFVTSDKAFDFALYALNARNGALLHRTNVDPGNLGIAPVGVPAIDGGRGRAYVLMASQQNKNLNPASPGSIAVVDITTGALRVSVNLGDTVNPEGGRSYGVAIAIDTRTRHLFALTGTHVVVLDTTRL
jgi:DNA-binding beta-propeller fold protein YncE